MCELTSDQCLILLETVKMYFSICLSFEDRIIPLSFIIRFALQPLSEFLYSIQNSFSLYILKLKRKGRILTEELDKEEKTATIITKMAKTDYPISELISRRWSARAFSTKPVEKSKLLSLLEAARWAPSSRNEQPRRYIVFTNDNPEKLKKAHSVLKEINDHAKRDSNSHYDTDTIPPTYQAWLYQKVFCECCGMQLRTTPMISAYKRILKERLYTVGEKAAGRNNTPGSGS